MAHNALLQFIVVFHFVAFAWDENGGTDVLSWGTDVLGYGTAAGVELDCYTADGEDVGDNGSLSDRSGSYVTRDGGTTSNNFPCPRRCCSTIKSMTTAAVGWQ